MRRQAERQRIKQSAAAAEEAAPARFVLSRRGFICLSAAAAARFLPVIAGKAAFAGAALNSSAAANAVLPADFQEISQFLTRKPLSPLLAQRVWGALALHSAGFAGRYEALRDFIRRAGAADIDALKGKKSFQGALRQTALEIISAYYLGYIGAPQALRAHDDVVFITYTQALMYRLTYEHTPIPTYSRWGGGYWGSRANPR